MARSRSLAATGRGLEGLLTAALAADGVFTYEDAMSAGVSRSALDRAVGRGRIERVLPRTYVVAGVPRTWWRDARAATRWSDGVLSHGAASFALGLTDRVPEVIDVSGTNRQRPPTGTAIVPHNVDVLPQEIVIVREIPVTSGARTLLDVGAVTSDQELETMFEEALRRGLVSCARLRWQLRHRGRNGRPGTAALRNLLDRRDPRQAPAESVLETKVARWFRSTRLPPPTRQFRVVHEGRHVARLDFAYPRSQLAIEALSYRWHSGRREWLKDRDKKRRLEALGWTVKYVIEEDVDERSAQLEREIAAALGITLF
ncbi:MAG TPA: type IV toxin-antitoxin system AbiEi family antitoxin domain-containing protein [Actinomycetota bacterium]|nr:type IV toxin-antitoxin system AbiEi family antitoxin domain-containing protein [Actinomycetota bacterium]